MSDTRDQMISELKAVVVPQLRERGFSGSFPHFRRVKDQTLHLLTFQFYSAGGKFVVEVAFCPADGGTMSWRNYISPKKVTAHHINQRLRLGATSMGSDHWFDFDAGTQGEKAYRTAAEDVLKYLPQAERYWESSRP